MGDYIIGADIGTTQTKCVLMDSRGVVISSAAQPYPTIHNGVNRAEQAAEEWWNSLVSSVRKVIANIGDPEGVRAISLSTQGGSMVAVSDEFEPLIPGRVWTDARCCNERRHFERMLGVDYVHKKTGWALGEGMMALQIANIRNEAPHVFAKTKKFLSVPDYIAWKLTGRAAIDAVSIGIDQMGDIQAGNWDEGLMNATGIDESYLPEIVKSGERIGCLTAKATEELGLSREVQVYAGAHDQYCVALGSGAIHSGDVFVATGTAWVVTGISDVPDTRFSFGRHAIDGLWGSIIALSSGGACLEWLREEFLPEGMKDYAAINAAAAEIKPGSEGMMFYPNLYGAQYPENRRDVHGAFSGLSPRHGAAHMIRSVMEGVCFHVAWAAEAFNISPCSPVNMVGGGTKSSIWPQILADIMNRPVCIPGFPDVGAVGAAMIAGVGAGMFESYEQACESFRRGCGMRVVEPSENAGAYREMFEKYKHNYQLISQLKAHE